MNSQTKMIIGAVAGAALGTLIVGMFTTDEGRRTRRKLHKKTRKLRNKTLQQMGEFKVGSRRKFEKAKQATNSIIDQGKGIVSGVTGNAGNATNAGSTK